MPAPSPMPLSPQFAGQARPVMPSLSPTDYRERDAQSVHTDDPFLHPGERLVGSGPRGSGVDSSNHPYYSWTWEIISTVLSILCTAAMVGVLVVYQSRPAPTLPSGLTLNALISLLATISKAAMLVSVTSCISQLKWRWFRRPRKLVYFNVIDEASRGPWGSVELLWKTRVPSVVGLGALITMVALGIDPFMQQLISYPTRSVNDGSSSTSRAQMYDTGFSLRGFSSGLLQGPELGMKAAIYNGIFKQSNSTDNSLSCSTGNCTFPLFDSLAFCSKCRNATDTTILSSHRSGASLGSQMGTTVTNYTYTLPGNHPLQVTAFYEDGEPSGGESASLLYGPAMISNFSMPESMSQSQFGVSNPISSLAILQFPEIEKLGKAGNYLKQTPQAWQCALYFCLQTYNASVLNGVPSVDTISSWNSDVGTPLPSGDGSLGEYMETKDATFERPGDSLVKGGNSTFFIPGGTIAIMATYLNQTMSGVQLVKWSEINLNNNWPVDILQALNSRVDIAGMMTGLASSVTTFIRQSDNRGSLADTTVTGTAQRTETYVHVRWSWFALPAAALVLSIIFLLTAILLTSKERIPVWKSSSLALLLLTLDDNNTGIPQPSGLDRFADMEEAARATDVRLQRGVNGEWNLATLK